jgi:hypothetical protein
MRCLCILLLLLGSGQLMAQSYIGSVTGTVNFRSAPETSSQVFSSLVPGTPLFIVSTELRNGYYEVVNIETNQEGYVHHKYVEIGEEVAANTEGIFTPVLTGAGNNPTLKILNNTNLTLTLKMNEQLYSFAPKESKEVTLNPGSYRYRASAPGVIPDHGIETLKRNYEYDWQFFIETRRY